MQFTICMKTPDAVKDTLNRLVAENPDDVSDEIENAEDVCRKWFRYGETVYLRVDTDTRTIEVLEA